MVWLPLQGGAIQRVLATGKPAVGYVLKLYAKNTSDNIPMATDSTGDTTVAYGVFNSLGDLVTPIPGTAFFPHIDQDYKYVIYPSVTAANSDTGAILTVDNNIFDVSSHVVDNDTFNTINVTGDANFGDNIFVANTTHTTILKEKWLRVEIEAGVLTVDLALATVFIYDVTEEHDITLVNLPEVSDGYTRTFGIVAENAEAFTTHFDTDGYIITIRQQDLDITLANEVMYVCSIYKVGRVFVGIQNDIGDKP
jgi:hypothetical protein